MMEVRQEFLVLRVGLRASLIYGIRPISRSERRSVVMPNGCALSDPSRVRPPRIHLTRREFDNGAGTGSDGRSVTLGQFSVQSLRRFLIRRRRPRTRALYGRWRTFAMSYSVKLTDDVVRKLNGWHLIRSTEMPGTILADSTQLSSDTDPRPAFADPTSDHRMTSSRYDLVDHEAGGTPSTGLHRSYTFTVRYGADEETLFIVDCELLVEDRPPFKAES